MKKILLSLLLSSFLLLLLITPASPDTSGTNYTLRSNLKKDLTITGSLPMQNDLDMGGFDILNAGDVDFDAITTDSLIVSLLTATRVIFAGIGGLLSDDADLTFILDTLHATNLTSTGTITGGTLTDGTASLTGGVGTGYTLNSPQINGLKLNSTTQTNTNYTALVTDDIILFSTGVTTRTLALPAAVTVGSGKVYYIKKIDSGIGLVTVDPDGSETIDGDLTPDLVSQYESWMISSDGSNWHVH